MMTLSEIQQAAKVLALLPMQIEALFGLKMPTTNGANKAIYVNVLLHMAGQIVRAIGHKIANLKRSLFNQCVYKS